MSFLKTRETLSKNKDNPLSFRKMISLHVGKRKNEADVPYEKDAEGNEVYPKVQGVGEIYRNTQNKKELYARRKNGGEYYAKDHNNNEIYAVFKGMPVPVIGADRRTAYAKDADGNEYYYRKPSNNKDITFSDSDLKALYAKDKNGNELYPNVNGREAILRNRYAQKSNTRPFYPKGSNGDEYLIANDNPYIVWEDKIIYPVSNRDRPLYPLDENGNEYYIKYNNRYHIGRNRWNGDEQTVPVKYYYARKSNQDEFYPPDGGIAHESVRYPVNGEYYLTPKYAFQQSTKHIVYPQKVSGDQYYLRDPARSEDIVTNCKVYAKLNNNREIYPIAKVQGMNYERLFKHYAKDEHGHAFYPLDTNGNEYLLIDSKSENPVIVRPAGYPITNDHFIIVPRGANDAPFMVDFLPTIESKRLLKILVRDINNNNDFLTDIQSHRKSRSAKVMYKAVPYTSVTQKSPTQITKIVRKNSPFKKPYILVIVSILITLMLWVAWFIWIRKPIK